MKNKLIINENLYFKNEFTPFLQDLKIAFNKLYSKKYDFDFKKELEEIFLILGDYLQSNGKNELANSIGKYINYSIGMISIFPNWQYKNQISLYNTIQENLKNLDIVQINTYTYRIKFSLIKRQETNSVIYLHPNNFTITSKQLNKNKEQSGNISIFDIKDYNIQLLFIYNLCLYYKYKYQGLANLKSNKSLEDLEREINKIKNAYSIDFNEVISFYYLTCDSIAKLINTIAFKFIQNSNSEEVKNLINLLQSLIQHLELNISTYSLNNQDEINLLLTAIFILNRYLNNQDLKSMQNQLSKISIEYRRNKFDQMNQYKYSSSAIK